MKDKIVIDGTTYFRQGGDYDFTIHYRNAIQQETEKLKSHFKGELAKKEEAIKALTISRDSVLSTVKRIDEIATSQEKEIVNLKTEICNTSQANMTLLGQVEALKKENTRLLGNTRPESYLYTLETEIVAVEKIYTEESNSVRLTFKMPIVNYHAINGSGFMFHRLAFTSPRLHMFLF